MPEENPSSSVEGYKIENEAHVRAAYSSISPFLAVLKDEVIWSVRKNLDDIGVRYSSIEGRVKDIESVLSKARRKELSDPLSSLKDIVGIRIILMFRSDIQRVVGILKECFDSESVDNKIESSVSEFGYMSFHMICRMPSRYTGPRYEVIPKLPFEIQVRTISMHAWASISHHLDYKVDAEVPFSIRKSFGALSGLFYVADSMFESIAAEVSNYREMIAKAESGQDGDRKNKNMLDIESLDVYLENKFPDRGVSDRADLKKLLNALLESEIKSVSDLDAALDYGAEVFLEYERLFPPTSIQGRKTKFTRSGATRVTLSLYHPDYQKFEDRTKITVPKNRRAFWEEFHKTRANLE